MGNCFTSGGDDGAPALPPEEKVISRFTSSFGFHRRQAKECVACILANSANGKANDSQFNTIVTDLSLAIVDLDVPDSKHFAFFKQFRDKKLYDATKLCALSLLLGSGTLKEKAGAMFDAIPNQTEGEADSANLRLLWKTMVQIAAEVMPFLAIEENPISGQSLSNEACRGYVSILEKAEDQLVSELVEGALFGLTRIRKADFESRLSTMPVFQVLANPDRVRSVLYSRAVPKASAK